MQNMMAALSVPKRVTLQLPGTPYFKDVSDVGDPGNDKTLLTDTVPANTIRNIQQIVVVCTMEGVFQVLAAGQVVGSGRTSGSTPNVSFAFNPWRPFSASTLIEVVFRQRVNSPPAPVEVYLQASDVSTL
jgi:hypothetical protein